MMYVSLSEVILRLAAAAVLSLLLGLDREAKQKSFGLRTHMLLCIGTTAYVLMLMEMIAGMKAGPDFIHIDPTRVIQAVIVGIGFLGAGAVIQSKNQIHGATTSVGIWVTGSIGLACGFGLYIHAAIITGFVLLVITVLYPFDRWLESKKNGKSNY